TSRTRAAPPPAHPDRRPSAPVRPPGPGSPACPFPARTARRPPRPCRLPVCERSVDRDPTRCAGPPGQRGRERGDGPHSSPPVPGPGNPALEPGEGLLQDGQALFEQVVADDQGRQQPDDVAV